MIDRIGIGPGPVLKGVEVEENTTSGSVTTFMYEGSENECRAQRLFHRARGATRIVFRPKGDGSYELMVSYPWGENGPESEPPQNIYELEVNIAQRDVHESLVLRTKLTPSEIATVDRILQYYSGGTYQEKADNLSVTEEECAENVVSLALPGNANALGYFRMRAYHKVDNFMEYESVLIRTITGASPNQMRVAYAGINQIWTSAEVAAYERIPTGGWFALEANKQWHKAKPMVVLVAGQKMQIRYSYSQVFTACSLLYEAFGSATLINY